MQSWHFFITSQYTLFLLWAVISFTPSLILAGYIPISELSKGTYISKNIKVTKIKQGPILDEIFFVNTGEIDEQINYKVHDSRFDLKVPGKQPCRIWGFECFLGYQTGLENSIKFKRAELIKILSTKDSEWFIM